LAITSCHQTSRPSKVHVGIDVVAGALDDDDSSRPFTPCLLVGLPIASSALVFRSRPSCRGTPSAGDQHLAGRVDDAVGQRVGAEAAEDDEWIAPMRAQASIATASSGIIGM
jgi:hypothetical protein